MFYDDFCFDMNIFFELVRYEKSMWTEIKKNVKEIFEI